MDECSSYLKNCSESSLGLWRLGSVEFHLFVVCWCLCRLLSLFPINFEIWKDDLNEFASNVVKIRKLKFLEALELDSGKVLRLLNVC